MKTTTKAKRESVPVPPSEEPKPKRVVHRVKLADKPLNLTGEWLTIPEALALLRCSRQLLYLMFGTGAIKSISRKLPGRKRGARLVSRSSIEAYLARQTEELGTEVAGAK
jgi:hypothetical protein